MNLTKVHKTAFNTEPKVSHLQVFLRFVMSYLSESGYTGSGHVSNRDISCRQPRSVFKNSLILPELSSPKSLFTSTPQADEFYVS